MRPVRENYLLRQPLKVVANQYNDAENGKIVLTNIDVGHKINIGGRNNFLFHQNHLERFGKI